MISRPAIAGLSFGGHGRSTHRAWLKCGDGQMTLRDCYDEAIDQILESAQGDVRLALRTVLMQNVQLEAQLIALSSRTSPKGGHTNRKDLN
jgi:hypothetical protein